MFAKPLIASAFMSLLLATATPADQAAPLSALAKMPVKEITVFKDGHAFVLHEGKMPTDPSGDVLMDYLPSPVLGTFWSYSKGPKLNAVVASQHKVLVERTALTIRELLLANIGTEAIIQETPNVKDEPGVNYSATIVGIPTRSSEEQERTSPPNDGEKLPQPGNIVLLKTINGVKTVNIDRIQDLTFKGDYKKLSTNEEFRNLLRMKLAWKDNKPENAAEVGMVYLQRGVRWIPEYKITIDGKGSATVLLQAAIINELTDLEDVTANLVVGVPTFTFKDTTDPIALQTVAAKLSQYFAVDSRMGGQLSNAIMSQARMSERTGATEQAPADLGPEIGDSKRTEDLFVFTVRHMTLKKGQRLIMPISEFTLPYKDVYTLNVPISPPPEVWRHFATHQQAEIAKLMAGPKVIHNIRLTNKSNFPLTTAPALISRDERVLAQGMMTYTPKGGEVDLAITTAVDIGVKKIDKETNRTPNAANWQGNQFARLDFSGTMLLTNRRGEPVYLEVTRCVLGNVGEADHDGKAEMLNVLEDSSFLPTGPGNDSNWYPYWWGWYSWPNWWAHFNGVGKITWKFTLEAGKDINLDYSWHYYWR